MASNNSKIKQRQQ